jgi:hypothetical protein
MVVKQRDMEFAENLALMGRQEKFIGDFKLMY